MEKRIFGAVNITKMLHKQKLSTLFNATHKKKKRTIEYCERKRAMPY